MKFLIEYIFGKDYVQMLEQAKYITSESVNHSKLVYIKPLLLMYEMIKSDKLISAQDVSMKYAEEPCDTAKLMDNTANLIKSLKKPSRIGKANQLLTEFCNKFPKASIPLQSLLIKTPMVEITPFSPVMNVAPLCDLNSIDPVFAGYFGENLITVSKFLVMSFEISADEWIINTVNSYFRVHLFDKSIVDQFGVYTKFTVSMFESPFAFIVAKTISDLIGFRFDPSILTTATICYNYIVSHEVDMKDLLSSVQCSSFLHSISRMHNQCGVKVENGVIDLMNEQYVIDIKCYKEVNDYTPSSWFGQLYTYRKRINGKHKLVAISLMTNQVYRFIEDVNVSTMLDPKESYEFLMLCLDNNDDFYALLPLLKCLKEFPTYMHPVIQDEMSKYFNSFTKFSWDNNGQYKNTPHPAIDQINKDPTLFNQICDSIMNPSMKETIRNQVMQNIKTVLELKNPASVSLVK